MTSLTVSMPAYNEAANIAADDRHGHAPGSGPWWTTWRSSSCDDGSKDGTGEIVRELSAAGSARAPGGAPRQPGLWRRRARWRLGGQQRAGLFHRLGSAVRPGRDRRAFCRASTRPTWSSAIAMRAATPGIARLFGNGWSWLVNLLFGYTARDVDCAFKLFRRKVIETIQVESGGAMFSAEFLVRAKRAGFRLVEEPVSHYPRRAGKPDGRQPARHPARLPRAVSSLRCDLDGVSARRRACTMPDGKDAAGQPRLPRADDRAHLILWRLWLPRAHPGGGALPAESGHRVTICTYHNGRRPARARSAPHAEHPLAGRLRGRLVAPQDRVRHAAGSARAGCHGAGAARTSSTPTCTRGR